MDVQRPDRPLTPAELQLWLKVIDHLALLTKTQVTYGEERLLALVEEGSGEEVGFGVREKVVQLLEAEEDALETELAILDSAIGLLSGLLALQAAPFTPLADPSSSAAQVATLSSPSPGISKRPPLPKSLPPQHPTNFPPVPAQHYVAQDKRSVKERKAELAGQLPLAPGRRVAFRVPFKAASARKEAAEVGATVSAETDADWMLAYVKKRVGNDDNRYAVVDADTDKSESAYNTTLRSLVPLPSLGATLDDPAHPSYFAPHPVGSSIIAVYPNTTLLYRGSVVSTHMEGLRVVPGLDESGNKKRVVKMALPEHEQRYVVEFRDDDGQQRRIGICDIAEWPGGQGDTT